MEWRLPRRCLPASTAISPVRLEGRELLVLQLFARGYARVQIKALLADGRSVDELVAGALKAFGVQDVSEAIAVAVERGLIVADAPRGQRTS